MYQLTLSQEERKAIDWIGDRYAHGNDLYDLLWDEACTCVPYDRDWSAGGHITFHVPESTAWEIQEIVQADDLACFGPRLVEKFQDFCCEIV